MRINFHHLSGVCLLLLWVSSCISESSETNNTASNTASLPTSNQHTMSSKKILFVLTSHDTKGSTGEKTGFYLGEAAHPWKVLSKAGYHIDYVSPKGGEAPVDGKDLDDPVNKEFWENDACRQAIANTMTPDQVNIEDYAAIHYVGGHGTMWDFPDNKSLAAIGSGIYEQGGIVSAVCHGPAGLVNIKLTDGSYLVDGKTVSGFTNEEEEAVGLTDVVPFLLEDVLMERGANFEKTDNWQVKVSVDGRLITGQNPASATAVGEALKKQLEARVAS